MERLKELREFRGLSQKQLAKELGTSNKNLWAYESGFANPNFDMLIKIANFFGVSIDYLLEREDDFGIVNATSELTLTQEQKTLLEGYDMLNEVEKNAINLLIDSYLKAKPTADKRKKAN